MPVAGTWPMATKTPATGITRSSPDLTFLTRTPVTARGLPIVPSPSPTISSTVLSHTTSIFGWRNRRSCMMRSARKLSRRWMTVTLVAWLVRYSASSTAELPPPITATSLPRKKKPSQVAQADTPKPR